MVLAGVLISVGSCRPDASGGAEGEVAGGGAIDVGNAPLLVLAAASLTAAMDELARSYEAQSGVAVTPVYGASGSLAAQLRHGAPADLLFAADETFVDGLIRDGAIDATTRRAYAIGRLALVVPPGSAPPAGVQGLSDDRYGVVAIANPDHAPYGQAAQDALRAAGVLDSVGPRLVLAENVAQALQYVRTGNADAGLVALSLLRRGPADGEELPYRQVDASLHRPLVHVAGVSTRAPRPADALAFLDFVTSVAGQDVLARHGLGAASP
jgi:molybdate transport system substrate-binding protein